MRAVWPVGCRSVPGRVLRAFGDQAFDLFAGDLFELVLQAHELQCARWGALEADGEVEPVGQRAGLHLDEQPYPGGVDERDLPKVEDEPSEAAVELVEALEEHRSAGQAQLATHVHDHGLSVSMDMGVEEDWR